MPKNKASSGLSPVRCGGIPPKNTAIATVAEAPREIYMSPMTVAQFCRLGKIEGAYRQGRLWRILRPIRLNGQTDIPSHGGQASSDATKRPFVFVLKHITSVFAVCQACNNNFTLYKLKLDFSFSAEKEFDNFMCYSSWESRIASL